VPLSTHFGRCKVFVRGKGQDICLVLKRGQIGEIVLILTYICTNHLTGDLVERGLACFEVLKLSTFVHRATYVYDIKLTSLEHCRVAFDKNTPKIK
jgi:hypothetical protein